MKRILLTLMAIASLSLANAHANQIFYDPYTGMPQGYLCEADEVGRQALYTWNTYDDEGPTLLGYLEDHILMNNKDIHSIGLLQDDGNLYTNNWVLLGFFKVQVPLEVK